MENREAINELTATVKELCTDVYDYDEWRRRADEERRIADDAFVEMVWVAVENLRERFGTAVIVDAAKRCPQSTAGRQLREALRAAKVPRDMWYALRGDENWPDW